MVLQIAAWLYGSSLAKLIGEVLVEKFGFNLFPGINEVFMPSELGMAKSLDMAIFSLTILVGVITYGVNFWIKKHQNYQNNLVDIGFLMFSCLLFWQVWMVHTASLITLLVALGAELIYLVLVWNETIIKWDKDFPWQNAVLVGYWAMTVMSSFSTSLLLSLSMLIIVGLKFLILYQKSKFKKIISAPTNLLFLIALFIPNDLNLLLLGVIVFVLNLIWSSLAKREYRLGFIYDAAIIILITYNSRFYVGNYDFIEEGFWLGWLQRLEFGQVMYRDFFVYHPPLILKFVYVVTKFFGESIFSLRLGLQILKVIGLLFYFYLLKEVLDSKLARIILFAIVLGLTTTLVRNNVEIRLGMGLLAILFWYKSIKTNNKYWLIGSGIITGLSVITSLEIGVAVGVAIFSELVFFEGKGRIGKIGWWILGGLLVAIPLVMRMSLEGALLPAIEQLSFYSEAFSSGYFNSPILTPPVSSYFHWSLLDEYLSSSTIGWELAKLGLLLGIFVGIKKFIRKEVINEKDKLIGVLVVFELIVFRGALGRSDWFHLLFVLLISLVLIAVVMEKTLGQKITSIVLGGLLLIFARENGFRVYLDDLLINWQTHGEVFNQTQSYDFHRAGILVDDGVDVNKLNPIVKYLNEEINEEEVFMFPWIPDLYYFSELKNPTRNDVPYSFFNEKYQKETVQDLVNNPQAIVVFNPLRSFGGFDAAKLEILNQYIQENYKQVDEVGDYRILKRI